MTALPKHRTVLVVEDEEPIRRWLTLTLSKAGFATAEAADGEHALTEMQRPEIDLVLLDLMLPRMDGFAVLAEVRNARPALPVIIVSARISEDDRVRGLQLGADDYVMKPFSPRELLARVDAVLRRSPQPAPPIVRISSGDTVINCARREARGTTGERASLSQIEVDILEQLAAHSGRALSREELSVRVWGLRETSEESRAVDMHITRLRHKLAAISGDPAFDWIVTVRGTGYMLGPSVDVGGSAPAA